jgi:hypothetical protein
MYWNHLQKASGGRQELAGTARNGSHSPDPAAGACPVGTTETL